MKKNDSNLFYTCSLIELIGRTTRQKRKDVVNLMGEKIIRHIYHHADTLHCEPIAKIADYYIDFCHIPTGEFDNIASCKYSVPSYWEIGKVYARLIEDIQKDDVIFALIRVYNSTVSDSISYYNSDFFYQPRGFIKEQFLSEENAVSGETSKKPAIRFRGFTDSWEQRKLGEIVERVVRKNTNNESTLPLTISAQYGLVDQITYFNNRVASRDVSNYYLVLNGEFAYNKSTSDGFPFGAVKRLDLYPMGVLSTLYIVFSIQEKERTESDYLSVFFDTDRWHRGVAERAAEGARNHGLLNITAEDFFDIDLFLPPKKQEQEKIGSFFRALDNLITLHQRKHEKLVSIKKALLEKMFPKNGTKIPEIRFSGFTDAWEQRRLGECFDERQERSAEGELISVTINFGIKKFDELGRHDNSSDDKSHYKKVVLGDIAYNSMRMWQGASGYSPYNGILSPAYTVITPRDGVSSLFFSYVLKRETMIHTFQNRSQGITSDTWNLKFPAFSEIDTMLPTKQEQEKIAVFFREIDSLITLHQRELEKLRNIKKACLEKMFV
jgi:type I restriction enzyme S subunit